jgi:hypothetical protein
VGEDEVRRPSKQPFSNAGKPTTGLLAFGFLQ